MRFLEWRKPKKNLSKNKFDSGWRFTKHIPKRRMYYLFAHSDCFDLERQSNTLIHHWEGIFTRETCFCWLWEQMGKDNPAGLSSPGPVGKGDCRMPISSVMDILCYKYLLVVCPQCAGTLSHLEGRSIHKFPMTASQNC